jgi:hypothetical protein
MRFETLVPQFIPPRRRELYLKIVDMSVDYSLITHRLHFLDNHFPPHKLDAALEWLVANKITGQKFITWFKEECQYSDLEMHRRLLRVVDNAPLDRVVAGKNFKV